MLVNIPAPWRLYGLHCCMHIAVEYQADEWMGLCCLCCSHSIWSFIHVSGHHTKCLVPTVTQGTFNGPKYDGWSTIVEWLNWCNLPVVETIAEFTWNRKKCTGQTNAKDIFVMLSEPAFEIFWVEMPSMHGKKGQTAPPCSAPPCRGFCPIHLALFYTVAGTQLT